MQAMQQIWPSYYRSLHLSALQEKARVLLLKHFIGDVRSWKADDANETIIFGVKNPAVDINNTTFYTLLRNGTFQLLGTTALGKDGGVQPHVYNDGTIVLLVTEAPAPGDSGNLADLYFITLTNKLSAESVGGSGTVDQIARNSVKALQANILAAVEKPL